MTSLLVPNVNKPSPYPSGVTFSVTDLNGQANGQADSVKQERDDSSHNSSVQHSSAQPPVSSATKVAVRRKRAAVRRKSFAGPGADQDLAEEPPGTNAPKRKRMSVACVGCRTRKIKCDGRKPSCLNCELYNDECVFVFHNDKRKPYPKEYIEALNSRIKVLEDLLRSSNVEFEPSNIPGLSNVGGVGGVQIESSSPERDENGDEDPDLIESLSARVGQLSMSEDGQVSYFGATSNLHLSNLRWVHNSRPNIDANGLQALEMAGLNQEAPASLREHALNLYWTWQHPIFNILDKKVFMRDMEAYYQGKRDQVRYFSPLLMNSILAIASKFDDSINGDHYGRKARILLDIEIERPRITTVQAAAILGSCEAGCGRDARGWIYSGMAIRLAFDLGYHINCDNWVQRGMLTEEEAHVRKVVFWGCFVFDRLWSCYMGRPDTIRLSDVSLSMLTQEDECLEALDTWQPYVSPEEGLPEIWRGFVAPAHLNLTMVHLVPLIVTTGDILEVMYSVSVSSVPNLSSFASKMHLRLASWYTNLPPPLLCCLNSRKPILPHVIVLHLQYWATTILLHRPFLSTVQNEASISATEACRAAALKISTLISRYHSLYSLRRINILVIHIVFTAATIHLMNTWHDTGVKKTQAYEGLKLCCAALSAIGTHYASANKSLSVIIYLMDKWLDKDALNSSRPTKQLRRPSATRDAKNNSNGGQADSGGDTAVGDAPSEQIVTQFDQEVMIIEDMNFRPEFDFTNAAASSASSAFDEILSRQHKSHDNSRNIFQDIHHFDSTQGNPHPTYGPGLDFDNLFGTDFSGFMDTGNSPPNANSNINPQYLDFFNSEDPSTLMSRYFNTEQ